MPETAFVFPGQASQYVGMGLDLYRNSELARKYYDYAEKQFDFSLKTISFYGPLKDLTETRVTQPAIFVHSVIIYKLLSEKGLHPDMVAGHSLGEYSALVAAGALTFEDALELVKIRAEEMQKAGESNPGTMAAIVGLSFEKVQNILSNLSGSGICQAANHNSPVQIAISGEIPAVQLAMDALKKAGAKRVIELQVGGAFHSQLMKPAKEKLDQALNRITIKTPAIRIYSNSTGTPTTDPEEIRKRLYDQLTSPVLWTETIMKMKEDGANKFVEVGPGKVLQGLIKRIIDGVEIIGFSTMEEIEGINA